MIGMTRHRCETNLRGVRLLEPRSFCERYARMKEGEYGYKGNWVRLLAHTLEISVKTVETWGSPPDFSDCGEKYRKELARIDALLQAEQLLREHDLSAEYLKRLE